MGMRTLVTCAACALLATGCMTAATQFDDGYDGTRVYSGTLADVNTIGNSFLALDIPLFVFWTVDLPLSLAADTLLLPVTIPAERARAARVATELRTDIEQPGPVRPIAGASPERNAEQLFTSCLLMFERLDPDVTDCYSVEARVVDAQGRVQSGAEYKRELRRALARLHERGGFVSFHDVAYRPDADAAGRARIEATLETSFSPERTRTVLVVAPGADGAWRIVAEEPAPAWPLPDPPVSAD